MKSLESDISSQWDTREESGVVGGSIWDWEMLLQDSAEADGGQTYVRQWGVCLLSSVMKEL